MSRRRMIFLALTALSALGFVVDRFLLGKPATAEASAPTAARPSRKAAPAPAKPVVDEAAADPSLAYLDKLESVITHRDVFMMTPEMLGYYKTMQEAHEETVKAKGPLPGSAEDFLAKHYLEGTFKGPKGLLAVINGGVVQPENIIDDFLVTRITPYSVELRRGRETVILRLPHPGEDARKRDQKDKKKPPARPQR